MKPIKPVFFAYHNIMGDCTAGIVRIILFRASGIQFARLPAFRVSGIVPAPATRIFGGLKIDIILAVIFHPLLSLCGSV